MTATPMLIGVTGHRDLTDDSAATALANVRELFRTLVKEYPDTPIQLLTGMADGADRLVARAALDAGISIQAVLPMPLELYRSDFDQVSNADLDQLLDSPLCDLMELPVPDKFNRESVVSQGDARDQLYERLGEYLIKNSGVLIALWDGVVNDLRGGTADVSLQYLNTQVDDELKILTDIPLQLNSTGYVFWVPVKRSKSDHVVINPDLPEKAGFLTGGLGASTLYFQADMPDELQSQLSYLNQYNAQYEQLIREGKFFSWGGFIDNFKEAEAHPDYPMLQAIDAEYVKADGLALFNQKFSDRQFKLFAYMAGLMGLLFLLYAKILASKVFLIGYLALFLAGFWMFKQTEHKQWFSLHLMQRVIAETLRVRFYLVCARINHRVDISKMLAMTGVERFSGFNWIKQVLRRYETASSRVEDNAQERQNLEYVAEAWLEDQRKYFDAKVHNLAHSHHKLEKIKQRLLIFSALSVVLLIFFKKVLTGASIADLIDLKTLLVFFMGLLPFWLGVWEIYQSKMAIKELLWQYKSQSDIFSLAAFKMRNAASDDDRKRILVDLGEKSLMENYLWTIHRYHREHEPPTAG